MLRSPHLEAAAAIRGKAIVTKEVFTRLLPELKARALCVAGLENASILQSVQDDLASIADGETWQKARDRITANLSPFLGEAAPDRAEILLRTHGFQAFQGAQWNYAQKDDDTTHLQYLTMEDERVRPAHAALEGIVLPKDDPFWQTHFPPWEWGCRCRTRPMNPDLVADERTADETRPPEEQLVLEGPALKKLHEGQIIRGTRAINVLPDDREGAFAFDAQNLTLPYEQLRQRYDPEVFAEFKKWAKTEKLDDGRTILDWLLDAEPTSKTIANPTSSGTLGGYHLHAEDIHGRLTNATPGKTYRTQTGAKQAAQDLLEPAPHDETPPLHAIHIRSGTGETIHTARQKTLAETEAAIRTSPIEQAAIYNPAGQLLAHRHGAEQSITFSAADIKQITGATVTHNHPSGHPPSTADYTFAARHGVGELRIVTAAGAWIIRPPAHAWRAAPGARQLLADKARRAMLRAEEATAGQPPEAIAAAIEEAFVKQTEAVVYFAPS